MTAEPVRTLIAAADLTGLPKLPKLTARERELIMGDPGRGFVVPFGSLRISDDNVRDAVDTDLASLARSIRRVGLLQPPAVETCGDVALVVNGHRRFLALAALGYGPADPVPVHYLADSDDGSIPETGSRRTLRMIAENVDRANLTPIDEANTIRLLHETYGMNFGQIGQYFGLAAKTVSARLQLLELPGDYAAHVGTTVGIDHAQRVGALIAAGAPTPAIDALWAEISNPDRPPSPSAGEVVSRAEKAHRTAQAAAAVSAGLEARGVHVITKLGQAPKRKGHTAEKRRLVPVDTPAALKAAPNASSLNVDGRPVLLVETSWDGLPSVWSVVHRKAEPPRPTADDWQTKRTAEKVVTSTVRRRRLESVPEAIAAADVSQHDVIRLALLHIIDGPGRHLAEAAAALGLEPVLTESDRFGNTAPDPAATVDAWAPAGVAVDDLVRLLFGVMVARHAAETVTPWHAERAGASHAAVAAVAARLAPIPSEADWSTAVDHATTKLKSATNQPSEGDQE